MLRAVRVPFFDFVGVNRKHERQDQTPVRVFQVVLFVSSNSSLT